MPIKKKKKKGRMVSLPQVGNHFNRAQYQLLCKLSYRKATAGVDEITKKNSTRINLQQIFSAWRLLIQK